MNRRKKLKQNNKGSSKILSKLAKIFIRVFLPLGLFLFAVFIFYSFLKLSTIKLSDIIGDSKLIHLTDYEDLNKSLFVLRKGDKLSAVYVLVLNEESNKIVEYYIPPSVYIDDYSNGLEGEVRVKDLVYAGELLEKGAGMEYAIWEIQNLVAFKFDSYFVIEVSEDNVELNEFHQLLEQYSNFRVLLYPEQSKEKLQKIESNKNSVDTFLTFRKFVNRLSYRQGDVNVIDISDPVFNDNLVLESGQAVKKVNLKEIDSVLRENIDIAQNEDLLREQVKIEVYNGSDMSGLASTYARMIKNSGCEVIRVGNASNEYTETEIFISDKQRFDDSLAVVEDLFVRDVNISANRPNFITTGDIVVVLGEDLKLEMGWKEI